jgi:hypothetical protein
MSCSRAACCCASQAICALTLEQVCCAAALKQGLLDACDSYKTFRRSSSSSSSSSSSNTYNAFVNDVLCILQDLAVQHLQVKRLFMMRHFCHLVTLASAKQPVCACLRLPLQSRAASERLCPAAVPCVSDDDFRKAMWTRSRSSLLATHTASCMISSHANPRVACNTSIAAHSLRATQCGRTSTTSSAFFAPGCKRLFHRKLQCC